MNWLAVAFLLAVTSPDAELARYHIDFARIFATPEAEKAERVSLEEALRKLEALRGKVGSDAGTTLAALQFRDAIQVQFNLHYNYLDLRNAVDTTDVAARRDASALESEVASRTAFLKDELQRIPDDLLRTPELAKYRFYFESLRRDREHRRSTDEEKILAVAEPLALDWQYDLHEQLVTRTDFGSVTVGGKELSVQRDRQAIAAAGDRAAREAGFRKRYAGFASQRDLYAFSLVHLADSRNALAKLRHFEDGAAEAYFGRYWSKGDVSSLLAQLVQHADVHKRYERVRAEEVKRSMSYDDANVWDMDARPSKDTAPHFTIDEARAILLAAVAPLGPDYQRELAALLDPSNGRLDIVPGPHRRSGGFSRGYPGMDSVFFSSGFTGTYNDVRVLMHESTHAVQRQLLAGNHVLPPYLGGPSYLSETYAIFNELLLADYLYQHETNPARRRFYLEQFLDGKGMVAFVAGPEAELEQAVYERAAAGTIHDADELDALTQRIYSQLLHLAGEARGIEVAVDDRAADVRRPFLRRQLRLRSARRPAALRRFQA